MFENMTFGVEIEFASSDGASTLHNITAALNAGSMATAQVASYTSRVPAGVWKMTTDSTCGYEAVSPILRGETGLVQLKAVLLVIEAAGATVDRNCGIHIHWGAQDLSMDSIRNVAKMYAKYETEIDKIMPESRRANNGNYMRSNIIPVHSNITKEEGLATRLAALDSATDMAGLVNANNSGSRYKKFNLESFWKHGTIEFRQHSGSLDFEKISMWIKFTGAMVQSGVDHKSVKPAGAFKFESMLKITKDASVRRFFRKRAKALGTIAR